MVGSKNKKFIITVGDSTSCFFYVHKGKLQETIIADSPVDNKILARLKKDERTPILVLMDITDQIYKNHEFPPVKGKNLEKLIQNQIRKDFGLDHLTAYHKFSKIQTGKKKVKDTKAKYNLIALNDGEPYGTWLKKLDELPNQLIGPYLMPVEQVEALRAIKVSKGLSGWHLLITETKTSNIRITVYDDENVVITRIITNQFDSRESLAKYIRTETDNTVEYIRRLGLGESGKINITAISSNELATALKALDKPRYAGEELYLGASDIDKKLKLSVGKSSQENSADRILAHILSGAKPRLPVQSEQAREKENLKKYGLIFFIAAFLIFGYMGYLILSNYLDNKETQEKNSRVIKEKRSNQRKYDELKEQLKVYPEDYQKSVIDYNTIHNTYNNERLLPINIIDEFAEVLDTTTFLSNLNIRNAKKDIGPAYVARFDIKFSEVDLSNVAGSLDEITDFIERTKVAMPNYIIGAEDYKDEILSKNILNNDEEREDVKILLNIQGPVESDEILGKN